MTRRAKGGLMYWLAFLCLILAVVFLLRWFGPAYEAGDAFAAAEGGVPYTQADLAGFKAMGDAAACWFEAAIGMMALCVGLSIWAKRIRRTP
jgi:hypothetical protein